MVYDAIMDIEFSKDQKKAVDTITDWYTSHTSQLPAFTFGGAAGTGKSTLISHLHQALPFAKISYCAYTGKAATVLRRKLAVHGIGHESISTIHSLMYTPQLDSDGNVAGWKRNPHLDGNLIVIDEASMVPKEIYDDLLSYDIPLLFVGDHYQLPPVSQYEFNLMDDPFVKLDTPHRFAADSPIVKLATKVRNGENIKFGDHGDGVSKRTLKTITQDEIQRFFQSDELKNGDSIMLSGFNKTRVKLNKRVRKQFGYSGLINNGERVVCLRNNKKTNIPLFNGALGTVKHVGTKHDTAWKGAIEMDGFDSPFRGVIYNDIFNTEKPDLYVGRSRDTQCFDYGYALSVHKSQGSSWNRVCVFEEQCDLFDNLRWLYTAVTRAENELLIIK